MLRLAGNHQSDCVQVHKMSCIAHQRVRSRESATLQHKIEQRKKDRQRFRPPTPGLHQTLEVWQHFGFRLPEVEMNKRDVWYQHSQV